MFSSSSLRTVDLLEDTDIVVEITENVQYHRFDVAIGTVHGTIAIINSDQILSLIHI